ncbi:MAG: hypothetical protein AAF483_04380 [Planctomycetota bacterium]
MTELVHHLPHNTFWDPTRLSGLLNHPFQVQTVGESVVVKLPEPEKPSLIAELFPHLIPPKVNEILIEYREKNFVRNVRVSCSRVYAGYDAYLPLIDSSLESFGCLIRTERQIVEYYQIFDEQVELLLDEIEKIRGEKESLVQQQDFDGAVLKRDEEYEFISKLDSALAARVER